MEDSLPSKHEILCKVCGDKASGKHYGVSSCDGCRGFFKRSIRRNLEYLCKESNRCIVDVTRRNQCQACRFRKCLQMHMKRDAVQHERAPRTLQSSLSSHHHHLHHHHPHYHPLAFSSATSQHHNNHHHRLHHRSLLHHPSVAVAAAAAAAATSQFFSGLTPPQLTPSASSSHSQVSSGMLEQQHLQQQQQQQQQQQLGSGCLSNSGYLHTTGNLGNLGSLGSLGGLGGLGGFIYPPPPPQDREASTISNGGVFSGFKEFSSKVVAAAVAANNQGTSSFLSTYPYNRNLLSLCSGNLKISTTVKDDEVTSSEEAVKNDDITISKSDERKPVDSTIELPILQENNSRRILEASCLTLFPAESIYESAAKLLFLSIKWARTIPSFLQLSNRDQSILLEESWNELFVLTAAQWALPIDDVVLLTNAIGSNTRQAILEEDARKLRDVINRLTLLRVDHTEHACLKALVLFKPECRGLCEPSHVELLQDQTHVMLHEYCLQRQTLQKGRFGKILLALPAVQAVTRKGLEELLFRQTVGDVTIDRLLGDLAKATNA